MSLLCVTVRRCRLIGSDAQFSTYVTLKLQNVKSTTVTVKGCHPSWEQDFMFETNRMDTGLVIELWNKGLLWDKLIAIHWLPLMAIEFATEVGEGKWLSLDAELELNNGEVCGTHTPTGHMILIEAHFEPPYEFQIDDVSEFSSKLELLNSYMQQEMVAWNNSHHNQLYTGLSEDSDYTSDVSYPIQRPSVSSHHPNSSPSQFGGVANLARNSTNFHSADSYDNVPCDYRYETYESALHTNSSQNPYLNQQKIPFAKQYNNESEPLFYNSRPHRRTLPQIHKKTIPNFKNSNNFEFQSIKNVGNNDENNESNNSYYTDISECQITRTGRRQQPVRKPSLERQSGFEQCDENYSTEHQILPNEMKYNNDEHYDDSAKLVEQFYSVDNSQFRHCDSYESYTNSLVADNEFDNHNDSVNIGVNISVNVNDVDVDSSTNYNQYDIMPQLPQPTLPSQSTVWSNKDKFPTVKQRILPQVQVNRNNGLMNWNNETSFDSENQTDIQTKWNCDKKVLWNNSNQSDFSLWQTVSEDHLNSSHDSLQHNANFIEDKPSPPYFTPKSSIDQNEILSNHKSENIGIGRQSTDETIPADEVHANEVDVDINASDLSSTLPSFLSMPPQHSAIKSENKPSGEPKTVTFSDDIPEKGVNQLNTTTTPVSLSSCLSNNVSSNGLSRARVRWISAFNKITSDFTEVFNALLSFFIFTCF